MTLAVKHDVVIVGAGPGGSSTAIRLAQFGFNVAIVERARFPRPHIGICMSDQTLALLDYLGVGVAFSGAGFWRRKLTAVDWGRGDTRFVPQDGFHTDRAILDQFLLNAARSAGVTVYQPAQLLETRTTNASAWRMTVQEDGGQRSLMARFVVDAAGRRGALAGDRIKDGPPLLAIHAKWKLANPPEFDGLIEAGHDAWLWYARTAHDRAVISVFCDPRRLKSERSCTLQSSYARLLSQFPNSQPDLLGNQCSDPSGCDASSHHSADPVGDRHIRVGDACLSVDPLSSQGVHLALQTGVQAAIIIHTILRKPANAQLAKQFFRMRAAERVARYAERTKSEYARVAVARRSSFWQERAGDAAPAEIGAVAPQTQHRRRPPRSLVTISPDAIIEQTPVIDGNFVEKGQMLRHPNIEGSVAYVDGVCVADLLSGLGQKLAFHEIPARWGRQVPLDKASRIASWLWDRGVLVEAT